MISLACGWTGLSWAGLPLHGMSAEAARAASPGRLTPMAGSRRRSLAESSARAVNWRSCVWPVLLPAWQPHPGREAGSGSRSVPSSVLRRAGSRAGVESPAPPSVGEAAPGPARIPQNKKKSASQCRLAKQGQPSLVPAPAPPCHHVCTCSEEEMTVS